MCAVVGVVVVVAARGVGVRRASPAARRPVFGWFGARRPQLTGFLRLVAVAPAMGPPPPGCLQSRRGRAAVGWLWGRGVKGGAL